ncbi:MAG: ATPase [Haloarculaceae archaeon]
MNVLVVGTRELRAGKTTFSRGLVVDMDAVGYKPRAGSDVWNHRDQYERATSRGRLYGSDARKLAAAGRGDRAPEDVNAIHRLWKPDPGSGTGLLGREDFAFVLDRVGESFVANATVEPPAELRERLPVDDAVQVRSVEQLNAVIERRHVPALRALGREIAATDRAVVESYADVARPIPGLEPDAVAVVEPARVRVYDGTRFLRACEVATGGPGETALEERVGSVVGLADPERTVALPALFEDERSDPDAVARAYEDAYEAVRAVAAARQRA